MKKVVKKTTKKEVTNADLARMLENMATKDMIDALAEATAIGFSNTATKDELRDTENRLGGRIGKVERKLDDIEFRLGRIESNHERRLDIVEDKIRILYTSIENKLKIKLPK